MTATTLPKDRSWSSHEMMRRFGVTNATVARWAQRWHGHIGSGQGPRRFTTSDVLVARAWQLIVGNGRSLEEARETAEVAIRKRPSRWLLLTENDAATFDDHADLIGALAGTERGHVQVIDLWSVPEVRW